jgi:hypothetical protein
MLLKKDVNFPIFKIFLFVFIFLFINKSLYSQNKYGLSAGFNYSKITGRETTADKYPLYRYNTGIFADFKYGENSTIQVELKYDLKGGILKDSITNRIDGFYEITERLDYVSLPVLYKYRFENKKSEIFLFYGGSISYLLKAKRNYYGEDAGVVVPPELLEYIFPYKNKDYSIDIFAGWGFRVNSLIFDFRYSISFNGIYGKKEVPIIRNSVFSANISYIFLKTKKKSYSNRR